MERKETRDKITKNTIKLLPRISYSLKYVITYYYAQGLRLKKKNDKYFFFIVIQVACWIGKHPNLKY